jgi:cell division protein FtsZ
MTINLTIPDIHEMKPRITVFGVGGAGGNAVNNMINAGLRGVDFVVANTDAQALTLSKAERIIQMGTQVTEGLGAGSQPEVGRAAAEEVIDEIRDHLSGAHMVFVTAGMGGGTGTGAAPVIARTARELGILTVGVVTKPFQFEGQRRMRYAEAGIVELQKVVDTLLVIPNQNLFRVANEKTTFADAFAMADQVLYSGVACITDLMVKEGLINLDFADVRAVMREMGKAMMGTGEASGEKRALTAAEAAISNPLIDDSSMKGARGLLISITGGKDLTLYEVDEAATRIRGEVEQDANIIVGATFDESLQGIIRVSVVATGIENAGTVGQTTPAEGALKELAGRLRSDNRRGVNAEERVMPAAQALLAKPAAAQAGPSAENAAHAAVAAAILSQNSGEEVSIWPIPMKTPVGSPPGQTPASALAEPPGATFIPALPERMLKAPRMPRVDELPLPAQNEIRAQRGEFVQEHPDKRRMSLMQRLASVGLGRRADETDAPAASRAGRPMPSYERQRSAPHPAQSEAQTGESAPDRGLRSTNEEADSRNRNAPVHNSVEEDQLEIPAFLRRQAN